MIIVLINQLTKQMLSDSKKIFPIITYNNTKEDKTRIFKENKDKKSCLSLS